jgi:hypothetical protein
MKNCMEYIKYSDGTLLTTQTKPQKKVKIFNYYVISHKFDHYIRPKHRNIYDIELNDGEFIKSTEQMVNFKNKMTIFLHKLYKKKDFRVYSKDSFYTFFNTDHNKYYSIEQIKFHNFNLKTLILNAITC